MTHSRQIRRLWRLGALVAVVLGVGCATWFWLASRDRPGPREEVQHDPPPPDPRLTFETPFRNVRPDVRYVGDSTCADCHADVCDHYKTHPMSRSAAWVTGRDAHPDASNNPVRAGLFELSVLERGGSVFHSLAVPHLPGAELPAYSVPVHLVIGSGRQGQSYVTLDRGAAWQSPLSWFRRGQRWDVSPGFSLGAASRRAVLPGCLFCHTNPVTSVEQTLNRYREPLCQFQPAIGCERCHGPGSLHVADRIAGPAPDGPDYSIVNPKHLAPELKADICRQCHLQGAERVERRGRTTEEYRPGLPFEQFVSVFVSHPNRADNRKSVGQFEQMEQSRCYIGSDGQMSCTSCHDPHAAPLSAAKHYRERCLRCHEKQGCSASQAERRARGDSCVACHMPASESSNIIHAAVTDHRVPRRPGAGASASGELPSASQLLLPYRPGPHAPPVAERERDWAVVYAREVSRAAASGKAPPELARLVQTRLQSALTHWPGDAICWSAAAGVALARGEASEAVAAARRAAALAPDSEAAQTRLAEVADATGDFARMAEAGQRLVAINPTSADYHVTLASALANQKQWEAAETEARAALEIHPLHPMARLILGACRASRGDKRAGRVELETALRLAPSPDRRTKMSDWYLQITR